MRRNGYRAFSAVLLVALLPSFAPDMYGLVCSHHMGHGSHDSAPESHAHHHGGHNGDAMPPGGSHHAPDAPPCTCVGQCPTASAPATPSTMQTSEIATPPSWRTPTASTPAPDQPQVRYLLPFANAPPLA